MVPAYTLCAGTPHLARLGRRTPSHLVGRDRHRERHAQCFEVALPAKWRCPHRTLRAVGVTGEIVYMDGSREPIDARSLISVPEAALSILWLALFAAALAVLLARWL